MWQSAYSKLARTMPKTRSTKKSKLKRHKRGTITKLGKRLDARSSSEVHSTVLQYVGKLPQLELYPERKTFWSILTSEHKELLQDLVDCLCHKYSQLFLECKGKYAYVDLQIHWHDFLRSVAASVEIQSCEDAQLSDSEYEAVLSSPTGTAWLLIVSAVSCQASRET